MNAKKKVFIIAEISANHQGDINNIFKMIETAKDIGVDAIKIQTYTADTITLNCNNENFQINTGTLWDGQTLYNLYQQAYTPWEWQPKIKEHADKVGITLFSTPFDKSAVDFLEKINIPMYKIASFEAVDIPLIEYVASKGKPIIISTGICSKQEIQESIDACKRVGNNDISILKCTSAYPAKLDDMNLATIPDMIEQFQVNVGLSDHTLNIETPIVAVSLGAKIIEKHFTLDRSLGGPDADFSLNPDEFKNMIKAIRNTEKLLGQVSYYFNISNRKFGRSLFVAKDIKAGEILTEENIRSVRPGNGLPCKYFHEVMNKKAKCDLTLGTPLSLDDIS